MSQTLQQFKAALFQALAHELRIKLLEALRDGELSVGELRELVGASGPNVSQHLAVLRSHGFVATRRDGTSVRYSIADPRLSNLLDDARAIFERRIAADAALLQDR